MKIKILRIIFLLSPFAIFGQAVTGILSYNKTPNIYVSPSYTGLARQAEIAHQTGIYNKKYCDEIEKAIIRILPSIQNSELKTEFKKILEKLESFKQQMYSQKTQEIDEISQRLEILTSVLEVEISFYEVENYMLQKQWNKAIERLQTFKDSSKYIDWKYSNLAICYSKIEDSYNAFASLNKMNNKVLMQFQKAVIKTQMKDYYGSNEEYNQILNKNVFFKEFDKATILNNIAYNNVKLKKFDIALKQVNEALLLNDFHSFIWDTKGEILYNIGKYSECINAMTKAIDIDNSSENSYFFRGLFYLKMKHKEKACRDFSKSGELGNNVVYNLITSNCN